MSRSSWRASLLALLVFGFAAGCDGKKDAPAMVRVSGKLTDGKKPWVLDTAKGPKLPPGTSAPPTANGAVAGPVAISFHPLEGGGDFASGNLDASAGTFTATVRPGRYKITLGPGPSQPGATDPFGGKFATKDRTQIVRDITKDLEEIVIDISKPTG